jgi:hypothetical protein
MFDIYFYNSYNLSAAGFQMVKVEYEDKKSTLISSRDNSDVPAEVTDFLTHGGAKMVLTKTEDDRYIYVIKGITCEDDSKRNDEPGRKWFINLAFVSDAAEMERLYSVVMLALTDFAGFKKGIVEFLNVNNSETSYSVDYEKLYAFTENCRDRFSSTYSILNTPYGLAGKNY